MGLIKKTICPKCGKEYSALKTDCPYCGAKKINPSERAPSSSDAVRQGTPASRRAEANARWQMLFGLCLVLAVIAGVIILVMSTLDGNYDHTVKATPTALVSVAPPENTASVTPSETPTPSVSTSSSPSASPSVQSITFTFLGQKLKDQEFATDVGKTTQLGATVSPKSAQGTLAWTSSDESIVTVDQNGNVTAVGKGWAKVTATAGDKSADCKVWVR